MDIVNRPGAVPFGFSLFFILAVVVTINSLNDGTAVFIPVISISVIISAVAWILQHQKITAWALIITTLVIMVSVKISREEKFYHQTVGHFPTMVSMYGTITGYARSTRGSVDYTLKVTAFKRHNSLDFTRCRPFLLQVRDRRDAKDVQLYRGRYVLIFTGCSTPAAKEGSFNYVKWLRSRGIYGLTTIRKDSEIQIQSQPNGKHPKYALFRMRKGFIDRLSMSLDSDSFALVQALYFGWKGDIDRNVIALFKRTGFLHLLALSGLHIGFTASLIQLLLKRVAPGPAAAAVSILPVTLYMLLLHWNASSTRAFIMFAMASLLCMTGRRSNSLTRLSLTLLIMITANPWIVYDTGFQFSFMAVTGILVFSPVIKSLLSRITPGVIAAPLSVSIAAFCSLALPVIRLNGYLPLFSLASSIIIIPLFTVYYSVTFVMLVVLIVVDNSFIYQLVEILGRFFLYVVETTGRVPPVYCNNALPGKASYIIFFSCVIIVYFMIPAFLVPIHKILVKKVYRQPFFP
jgi:ComEC/Rec2-related protein